MTTTLTDNCGARGQLPLDIVYDFLLENDGRDWICFPMINHAVCEFGPLHAMLTHLARVFSLADGSALPGRLICLGRTVTYPCGSG